MDLAEKIKSRAHEIGFDLAGIAPAAAWDDLKFSAEWAEAGYGGEMAYLSNPKRQDPRRVLPSVQSVVCVGLVYNSPAPYSTEVGKVHEPSAGERNESRAWISRYAWGTDYHKILKRRLEELRQTIEALSPQAETRVYVDTGPVVERAFARISGIGWMGKNTCLINQGAGSWFFIGIILTNLIIPTDDPAADRCGSCTRCLDACPTGALIEPYVMNASRCIAYLTIELRGSIPEGLRPEIGLNVFGCDICQDVCPWNSPHLVGNGSSSAGSRRQAALTHTPEFLPRELEAHREVSSSASGTIAGANEGTDNSAGSKPSDHFSLFNPPLRHLAELDEEEFRRVFSGSPVKRAKYRGWLRNLCVAAGNSGDRSLIPWLERAAGHSDPLIREHALWAIDRLTKFEPASIHTVMAAAALTRFFGSDQHEAGGLDSIS